MYMLIALNNFFVSVNSVTYCPDLQTITENSYYRDNNDNDFVADGCAVITDQDGDFGDIHTFNVVENTTGTGKLPSEKNDKSQLAHLSPLYQ